MQKSLGSMASEIQTEKTNLIESKVNAEEQRDKESRRNNLILCKVPESNAARAEERNKEDVSFCIPLFNNALQAGIVEENLLHVFRLGRRPESKDATRPLLVQLASYSQKNVILESLYKLKHSDTQFNRTVVAYNMTKNERQKCKQLVEDAKNLDAQDTSGIPVSDSRHPRQDEDCTNKNQTLIEANTPNNNPRNIINIRKLKVMYIDADWPNYPCKNDCWGTSPST